MHMSARYNKLIATILPVGMVKIGQLHMTCD